MTSDQGILIGQLAVGFAGFAAIIWQLHKVERSLKSEAQSAIYQQASDLRSSLVDCPNARDFLLGESPIPLPSDHPRRPEILTIAEMYLNYLEQLAVQQRNLGEENWGAWEGFVESSISRSPLLQEVYREARPITSRHLQRVVDPVLT